MEKNLEKSAQASQLPLVVNVNDVVLNARVRKDHGQREQAELVASIREFGLIEPLVLTPVDGHIELSAGGRRLAALRSLGVSQLVHGKTFVWLDERNADEYARRACELEENLRRKELTWQEEVTAKNQLLTLMQSRYGAAKQGHPTVVASATSSTAVLDGGASVASGFGVNKLAAMLGESAGQTSKDLQVAKVLAAVPQLAKAATKEAAFRMLKIVGTLAQMQATAKQNVVVGSAADGRYAGKWTLYEGDFRVNAAKLADASVDLVLTDLPYNAGLQEMSKRGVRETGMVFTDKTDPALLHDYAVEAYRVLRDDRFCVTFFGFNFYQELVDEMQTAGFNVNIVPAIWVRGMQGNDNPHKRYSTCYDPILVASKGSPTFIRQGQSNVMSFAYVPHGQQMRIAEKPVDLLLRIMGDMVAPGAHVVDFMCGAGSTGVAALKFGASVSLFEIDHPACVITRAKLASLT